MTWAETEAELDALNTAFIAVHMTPSKEQTPVHKAQLKQLRARCIELNYERMRINQMRVKTAELAGEQLNLAVGLANGWVTFPTDSVERGTVWHHDATKAPFGPVSDVGDWTPSIDWSQGGPIIEREVIDVESICGGTDGWVADKYLANEMVRQYGPTPLVAAMRCYVASKLGTEVEVP